jgi:flagellar hook-length control protein FliK
MNLSSYLQMPPAPSVPSSTPNLTPQGARAGASPSTGGNLGFDFAQVMAHQIQRLVPQERQTLAADGPKNPAPEARDSENARRIQSDQRSTARTDQQDAADRKSRETEASEDDRNDQPNAHARPRNKANSQKTAPMDAASLFNGLASVNPITPTPTGQVAATDVAAGAPTTAHPLQTIELSPQVRIITDPQKAPSPESLAAFAKSMGLDESAIQNLLGQQTAPAGVDATPAANGLATPTGLASPPPNAMLAMAALSQGNDANTPATLPGSVLNGATVAMNTTSDSAITASALNLPDAPAVVSGSGLGLGLGASTLLPTMAPGLTPTDMAAIQEVQITVLPAVVLPANISQNAPVPSTLDMLSLLGSGVDEQDVSALLTRFTAETGSQEQPSEQHTSDSESNNFSSFSQVLGRNNPAATPTSNAAQAAAPNMGDVYDQLSDKMATEMAARMHKQLSDGEWKMKFGLRPANLGGVEIHLEMKDGKLDAVFHADNPLTRDLLQNSSQRLREALGNFGINAGQVQVGQGGSNAQQNASGNSGKRPQVRDNSSSQVNGTDHASSVTATRNKANASLLDLYA